MKIRVQYFEIMSDHIFATPQYDREELVEATSLNDPKLIAYIESKKDFCGNNFKKSETKSYGFDYISNAGAVKVVKYIEPKVTVKL